MHTATCARGPRPFAFRYFLAPTARWAVGLSTTRCTAATPFLKHVGHAHGNVTCMCNLPKIRSKAITPRALCQVALGEVRPLPTQTSGAHAPPPAAPGAFHRRGVSPRTRLVIPNVICMCHLPKNRSEAFAPRAPCQVAFARCPRCDGLGSGLKLK